MDISRIRTFLDYNPVLDQSPDQLFCDVLKKITYLWTAEKNKIKKAYEYAKEYHKAEKRLSWEVYIVHPIKVMEFLVELTPDVVSLQVALLHDVIEDTPATYEDVKKEFGLEVADLCVALEKVAKVRYRGEERSIETLKKTFLAMGHDLRVILIKLADRVHNIQTLHYHPAKHKRQRIAEETLRVYVPIAKRLWLYVFQWFLENGAFFQLDQKEFMRISNWLEKSYGDIDAYKDEWILKLQEICTEDGVAPQEVLWRLKSPYRIYTKLLKYNTQDISKIMDIVAFRIITDSITDCYSDLGAIHKHFTPIFAKMKDYIAIPKPNGYKSLHTTVLGMFSFPVEIQIRTTDMDKIANYGVAAHFAYAEERKAVSVSEKQAAWIEKLQSLVTQYQDWSDKDTFRHELDIEILQKNIFVYTPKGDIIELPQESTVLDFAFRVHSDVWLKFKHALVNNRIVPIDFLIKTGDIIDIQTFKNKYTASKSWVKYLHTPSAKTKLNKYLRQIEKDDLNQELTPLINGKLQDFNLPLLWHKDDKILKLFPGDQREQQLFKIRDRQVSITRFLRQVYGSELVPEKQYAPTQKQIVAKKKETALVLNNNSELKILVDGDKAMEVVFCPECKPMAWNMVIARSWKDGIKIHTIHCVALDTVDPAKLIEAHRTWSEPSVYHAKLTLLMKDAPGVLLELLKLLEYLNINLSLLSMGQESLWWRKDVFVVIDLSNPSKITFILKELLNKKDICKWVQYTFIDATKESR